MKMRARSSCLGSSPQAQMHASEPSHLMWLHILKLDYVVSTVIRSELGGSDPRDI
jgi:hypothetical protein